MSSALLATVAVLAKGASTGETVTFWLLAPVALGSAIGMVFARNAVHAALLLVLDFFCLAVFYALQDAQFLAAVQVIVYTGAIMVLFLFVLMLVGVDSSDSLVETLRGQRFAAGVVGLGFAGLVVAALGHAITHSAVVGLNDANAGGNVQGIARLLFTDYVFPFEMTSALLIIAAMGAMVLGHKERSLARPSQRELVTSRFAGTHPVPQLGAQVPEPVAVVAAVPAGTATQVTGDGAPAYPLSDHGSEEGEVS